MTITFANPAIQNPTACEHWRLNFTATAQIGTKAFTAMVMRDELQSEDPNQETRKRIGSGELEDMAVGIAILEARRLAKAAGATNLAQANVAVRNQVVEL